MDITEIFRIWTQVAIAWIVSCMNRLFHVPQTWCGGGLRSLSASCLNNFQTHYILNIDIISAKIY